MPFRIIANHADEVANGALVGGATLFGIALADIATVVTLVAGVLSIVGLGLGIYLKVLQIRNAKKGHPVPK